MNEFLLEQSISDQLIIFYDGKCPLCSLEMQKLKRHDLHNKINLIDLHQPDFEKQFPDINIGKALAILHGSYQGKRLLGLDVTHRAWTLVGKGWLVAPLQWPVLKQLSHLCYLVLAKYRYPISSFIAKCFGIKANHCEQGTCYVKSDEQSNNKTHHRSK